MILHAEFGSLQEDLNAFVWFFYDATQGPCPTSTAEFFIDDNVSNPFAALSTGKPRLVKLYLHVAMVHGQPHIVDVATMSKCSIQ
jgi:hypothetical protein